MSSEFNRQTQHFLDYLQAQPQTLEQQQAMLRFRECVMWLSVHFAIYQQPQPQPEVEIEEQADAE